MANFDPAFHQVVMIEEGGDRYTCTPNDAGGATKWGITIPAAQDFWGKNNVQGPLFIRKLTLGDAQAFYKRLWEKNCLDKVLDQTAATKIFSACVNMGHNGAKCAQRAAGVEDDGMIGPSTVDAVNAKDGFVAAMASEMVRYYDALINKNPSQARFRGGWMARANWSG